MHWAGVTSDLLTPQEENMFPEQYLLIWSPALWTRYALEHTDNCFDPTILCLVRRKFLSFTYWTLARFKYLICYLHNWLSRLKHFLIFNSLKLKYLLSEKNASNYVLASRICTFVYNILYSVWKRHLFHTVSICYIVNCSHSCDNKHYSVANILKVKRTYK